jgi:hypothetical protein
LVDNNTHFMSHSAAAVNGAVDKADFAPSCAGPRCGWLDVQL